MNCKNRSILLPTLFAFLAVAAHAQTTSGSFGDFYAGFSYLQLHAPGTSLIAGGVDVSGVWFRSRVFGMGVDYSIDSDGIAAGTNSPSTTFTTQFLLAEPTFAVGQLGSISFGFHGLIGLEHESASVYTTCYYGSPCSTASLNGVAYGAGFSADLKITSGASVRLIKADYIRSRISGANENDFRVGAGIVFRF
jgi:hypothetical protein